MNDTLESVGSLGNCEPWHKGVVFSFYRFFMQQLSIEKRLSVDSEKNPVMPMKVHSFL